MNDKTWLLKERQKLPLDMKVSMSKERIKEWHNYWKGKVYVSFSGGKDSTVLLHLVRSLFPEVEAVFVDTGLEYPEIRRFVKSIENVTWLKPAMRFDEVVKKYGYPVISKMQAQYIEQFRTGSEHMRELRWYGKVYNGTLNYKISEEWKFLTKAPFNISDKCCNIIKKNPIKKYNKESNKKGFIGIMASDSIQRKKQYLQNGCNAFDLGVSRPLSFWNDSDIWEYIKKFNTPYSSIYDMGCERTGCMFCMFGVHLEKGENRFQRMKRTHPKQWDYCINKLGCGKVLDLIGVDYKDAYPLFSGTE